MADWVLTKLFSSRAGGTPLFGWETETGHRFEALTCLGRFYAHPIAGQGYVHFFLHTRHFFLSSQIIITHRENRDCARGVQEAMRAWRASDAIAYQSNRNPRWSARRY